MRAPLQLLRAEWTKIVGHRAATGLLLWIFPATALAVVLLFTLAAKAGAFSASDARGVFGNWHHLALLAWKVLSDPFGRVMLMGFVAFHVANEYQSGTWKNLVPRRRRYELILAKLIVICGLVLLASAALSSILVGGAVLVAWAVDMPVSPSLNVDSLVDLAPSFFLAAALAFTAFLITAQLAFLVSLYTQTIVGGALFGVLLIFLEPVLLVVPRLLAGTFEIPGLLHLARLLPLYHLENLRSWAERDQPAAILAPMFEAFERTPPIDSQSLSIAALLLWILVELALVLLVFTRQDITK